MPARAIAIKQPSQGFAHTPDGVKQESLRSKKREALDMTFYHASPVGGLAILKPSVSEHGKPYVYFATNPLVALLYAVKPVPKPFSFYPYGFEKDGSVVYSEYYENAFFDIYKGKQGFLYACHDLPDAQNPTQISCAFVCTKPVKIDHAFEIPDLYEYFKGKEKKGEFHIRPRHAISEKEMSVATAALTKDMKQHELISSPDHPMSLFIKTHFPEVWSEGEAATKKGTKKPYTSLT